MSGVRQDPEGLSMRAIAIVTLVAVGVGAGAVGAAALMTPRGLLAPTARHDPRTPIHGVERDSIERTARGLARHREARARLDEYGWVDRDAGVAHIPIERAMELVARGVLPPEAGEGAR